MKMTTMWSVSINNMIENEVCHHLTIGFKGRNYLFPLRKVVTNENDIIVPPTEIGLHVMKSTP